MADISYDERLEYEQRILAAEMEVMFLRRRLGLIEGEDCPRAPSPFRYCPDCDGSFPCQMPGGKSNG